jgi:LCCL domain
MKVIQELVAYFERRQKLTPSQIDKLARQGFLASDGPNNLMGLCDQVGQTHYFRVLGADTGSVWGTDTYTADSALAAAAVHCGAVPLGESAVVRVTVVEPLKHYQGSTRNGITTHSFGSFGTAFRVESL